jgi:hypothetical protein
MEKAGKCLFFHEKMIGTTHVHWLADSPLATVPDLLYRKKKGW